MVHGLYALSAGDQPRAARGAVELSDDDLGPDRAGGRQCLASGRGDGLCRGDGDGASGGQVEGDRVLRGRELPPAEHRRHENPRRAFGDRGDRGRPRYARPRGGVRRDLSVSRHQWRGARFHGANRGPARREGHRHRVGGPAGPDRAEGTRRDGGRYRRRHQPTVRRAHGLWRPARGLYGDQGRLQAVDAGADRGRERGCARQQSLSPVASDPRAAYPARKGHVERLHRAGPSGGHGELLCGFPRAGRVEGHRAERSPQRRCAVPRSWKRPDSRSGRVHSSTPSRSRSVCFRKACFTRRGLRA